MAEDSNDVVREAAQAMRPILDHIVRGLQLTDGQAERLVPWIAEAYIKGRADGADIFAEEVNRALSAKGIRVAVGVHHVSAGVQSVTVRVPGRD